MKTPHTPGPWTVKTLENGQQTVLDANGDCACVKTNARLIAAAPDLLAALQAATGLLLTVRDDMRGIVSPSVQANAAELCRLAESAIAKAQA